MKRFVLFLTFVFVYSISVYAVKAYSGLIAMDQSNGTTLNVYLYGDENFYYMTTEDGYLLAYNHFGGLEYAEVDCGVIRPVGVMASNIAMRTQVELKYLKKANKIDQLRGDLTRIETNMRQVSCAQRQANASSSNKGFPLKGSPKSLVILVNFSNLKFKSETANADFTRMLNQYGYSENGGTGSARDYFRTSSCGIFDPEFVVVGPYDLPEEMSYYGKDSESGSIDVNAGSLIVDACKAADEDIDFTEFDTNGDGNIDNVFVYYAGYNQAEGAGKNAVWPHRSAIVTKVYFDGVRIYDYACTSEFRLNKGGNMCGIGTFCHEFGHVLSLPDFYATDYATHATLGSWDIMDHGSYNNNGRTPPTYSAYERFYLGWLKPQQLRVGVYNLEPISVSNTAYLLAAEEHDMNGADPSPREFYLIENRHSDYEQDGVPANGMLVTHVKYNRSRWDNNTVNNRANDMGVEIVCASGSTGIPHQNVFPGSMDVTSLTLSIADTVVFDTISSIQYEDNVVSFVYGKPDFVPVFEVLSDLDLFSVTFGETKIQTIEINGSGIKEGKVVFSIADAVNYKLRLANSEDTLFVNSVEIEPDADGNVFASIDVRFAPQNYAILTYLIDNLKISTNFSTHNIVLRGKSAKQVFVVPPVAYEAQNVTPYTFDAVWGGEQFDATGYYLSVYSLDGADTAFVLNNEFLVIDSLSGNLSYSLKDLKEETTYYYRLRASDKDLLNGMYENITDYSNEIAVTTLPGFGVESSKLDVLKQGDKYVVYLPAVDENHSIFIYSVDGRLITSVPVVSNVVDLPDLTSNKVYILKYASNDGIKRKSKVIKLYYK